MKTQVTFFGGPKDGTVERIELVAPRIVFLDGVVYEAHWFPVTQRLGETLALHDPVQSRVA